MENYCMPDGLDTKEKHLQYLKDIGVVNEYRLLNRYPELKEGLKEGLHIIKQDDFGYYIDFINLEGDLDSYYITEEELGRADFWEISERGGEYRFL